MGMVLEDNGGEVEPLRKAGSTGGTREGGEGLKAAIKEWMKEQGHETGKEL